MAGPEAKKNIVIVGGGIIGSTCAYFLAHHRAFEPSRHAITLLEATGIAGGASGKAGGLLALWAYPACVVPLSFRLHRELAERHGGAERWGYRGVACGQLVARARAGGTGAGRGGGEGKEAVSLQKRSEEAMAKLRAKTGVPSDLDWVVAEGVQAYEEMAGEGETAQVHPYLFTTAMAALAEEAGVRVVVGTVTEIKRSATEVHGVTYTDKEDGAEKTIEADTVIVAAGPWTPTVYPPAPIEALRAHSVTIRPTRPVSAHALFTNISMPKSKSGRARVVTPEIYARPNNEVYACGEGDRIVPLPKSTDLVEVDQSRCQDVIDYVGSISDELRGGEVTARQACYLPSVSRGGGPMVGESGIKGLLIATGHTCWGIQNAPGTGKLISEMVWEGKAKSADISSLDPRRYM